MGPDRQTDFRRITDSQTDRFLLNIRRTELVKLKPLIIVVSNSGGPDRQTDFRRITDRQTVRQTLEYCQTDRIG